MKSSSRSLTPILARLVAGIAVALALLLALAPGGGRPTSAAPPAPDPLSPAVTCAGFGVNLSAAEFGSVPGTYGTDYIYPGIDDGQGHNNAWEMDYFHSKGIDLI